ncbi:MAG: hypothetical protein HQK63_16310 [Desulfamplus sp.]|nr:hypothetical protein [Desulfamplus sp.]
METSTPATTPEHTPIEQKSQHIEPAQQPEHNIKHCLNLGSASPDLKAYSKVFITIPQHRSVKYQLNHIEPEYIEKEMSESYTSYRVKRCNSEHNDNDNYIEYDPKELFDEFLSQQIEKIKELAVMFCESEKSSNTMFGQSLIDLIGLIENKIQQAAFQVNRALGGEIFIIESGFHSRLKAGTVFDAEFVKNGRA